LAGFRGSYLSSLFAASAARSNLHSKTMKLNAQLHNRDHEVSIASAEGTVTASVDGRSYELEVRELGGNEYLLLHGARVFRCRIDVHHKSQNSFEVVLHGRVHDVTIIDPKRLRSGHASGVQAHGPAQIVSPMPGKVVRILVKRGAKVEAGDGIVVVEAMKMQNELKSPKAGIVSSVNAEEGATVSAGDVLATIE